MVARRLVLVVGSQCKALKKLGFLPAGPGPVAVEQLPPDRRLAVNLLGLLVDGPGECAPVSVAGESAPGLLLNPTQQVADSALVVALAQAHEQEAVLVVCFVGHGSRYQADPADSARHLLHLWDTVKEPIDTEPESRGWDPYATVSKRRPHIESMVGLVLLVDACYASWAKQQVDAWSGVKGGLLAAWLGSSGDHEAWDGCFTRTLVRVLEQGLEASEHPRRALVPELLAVDLERTLGDRCPAQAPRLGGHHSQNPVLFLSRNRRASELTAQLGLDPGTETLLLRLTDGYVAFAVDPVARAVREHRVVAVVGKAGSGKSALAAALRHPPTSAEVPLVGLHALAFVQAGSSVPELARTLGGQLDRLPAFPEAARRAKQANQAAWKSQSPWQRLMGALREHPDPVRLLLDGLDQLEGQPGYPILLRGLGELVHDPALGHVKVVLTGRSMPDLEGIDVVLKMPKLDPETARGYLAAHGVDPALVDQILTVADGNWLVLELVTEALMASPGMGAENLPNLYARLLDRIRQRHGQMADAVLAVIAAAGTGPVLPFDLLNDAVNRLGYAVTRAELHTLLGDPDLHRLLDRTHPGQRGEHLGLFHQTLTDHLTDHQIEGTTLTSPEVHGALADAIAERAPAARHTPGSYQTDPLLAYAFTAAPTHLHLAGRNQELVDDLAARQHPIPAVNLTRHTTWVDPINNSAGPDDRSALILRGNIAYFTATSGHAGEALSQYRELLTDKERVLGSKDRSTLSTRGNVASWTGQTGKPAEALRLSVRLLPDQARLLGPDDPDTLHTRHNIAHWTGRTGDPAEALRLFQQLLPDRERVLGPDHPSTLAVRHNIAEWTGATGGRTEALRLFQELLPDRERVLGPDHPETLFTRGAIAGLTGRSRSREESLRLFQELLPDQERVLGNDHRETLSTRGNIVRLNQEIGDDTEALRLVRELLPDLERTLGPDHRDTIAARAILAVYVSKYT